MAAYRVRVQHIETSGQRTAPITYQRKTLESVIALLMDLDRANAKRAQNDQGPAFALLWIKATD